MSPLFVVELQSYNYPNYYIGVTGNAGYIVKQAHPEQWIIVSPGLCGLPNTISFQSAGNSHNYLRHRGFLLHEDPLTYSDLYNKDACFYQRKNKWFVGHDAFESVNYPGRFIRHQGYRLKLHPYESAALFEKDASFRVLLPNCNQFQSQNYPDYFFGLSGRDAYIQRYSTQCWILVSPGLTGHPHTVSFRACTSGARYLRHSGYLLREDSYDTTDQFKKDATFFAHEDKWFGGYDAYESINYPTYFIRHQSYRLKLHLYDGSQLFKKDGSYRTVPCHY